MRQRAGDAQRSATRSRSIRRLAVLGVFIAGMAACDSGGLLLGPDGKPIRVATGGDSTGTTTSLATAIVGTWLHSETFLDAVGQPHTSDITWIFQNAGSTTRQVVTSDIAAGTADTSVVSGTWRIDGTSLVLVLGAGGAETRLDARIVNDSLYLASQAYQRLQ